MLEIKNVKVYGLNESIIRSGYPMKIGEPEDLNDESIELRIAPSSDSVNRSKRLADTPIGSGHSNYLKGIIVQFDLKYPQYVTPQLQRYNWIDIISSQSKMHKLTSIKDISPYCNKYVSKVICDEVNRLISMYNDEQKFKPKTYRELKISNDIKKELFHRIISSLPMGYELWMGISTNYLQLKTIYKQRKTHKLEDWGLFCDWVESLPMSELITGR